MTTTAPTRVTYVESLSRNLIVADTSSRVVPERDPARIAREAGPGAYAFRFYDVVSTTADGIPVKSGHVNESPWYWIDAITPWIISSM